MKKTLISIWISISKKKSQQQVYFSNRMLLKKIKVLKIYSLFYYRNIKDYLNFIRRKLKMIIKVKFLIRL